jgi:hypothetical protein
MDIDAIKTGLARAVKTHIPNMHTPDNGFVMPQPPAFWLWDFTVTPHETMRYASRIEAVCRVAVGRQDPEAGGELIRGLASDGPGSVFYAIEKPRIEDGLSQDLGGACDDCAVTLVRGYRGYPYPNGTLIGFEILLKIIGERASTS